MDRAERVIAGAGTGEVRTGDRVGQPCQPDLRHIGVSALAQ